MDFLAATCWSSRTLPPGWMCMCAKALETKRALCKASAAFSGWAAAKGLPAPPATPEAVAAYVNALTGLGRKPASIRHAVWAIATLHRAAALAYPSQREVIRFALKRMARTLGTRQRQPASTSA
ncbi:hypothetical protein [Dankookia sp. GCM10030260]|uniref:hypothetical protein n=1 Tax=Dankookia sp. GCM10030260 TaxID=3273390 RepID=UPI0036D2986C